MAKVFDNQPLLRPFDPIARAAANIFTQATPLRRATPRPDPKTTAAG